MKNIAIFGGTFNPIHKGHINLCLQCDKKYNFDKIILIPTNIPPHKKAENLASNEDRYNMCKLATENFLKFSVSDIEQKNQGVSYTVDTLHQLKQVYSDSALHFIIGSDMLFMFHKWYKYEEILNMATIIVGARFPDEEKKMLEYKKEHLNDSDKIKIISIDVLEISSTQIRDMLQNDELNDVLLDKKVFEYIKLNNLYL